MINIYIFIFSENKYFKEENKQKKHLDNML